MSDSSSEEDLSAFRSAAVDASSIGLQGRGSQQNRTEEDDDSLSRGFQEKLWNALVKKLDNSLVFHEAKKQKRSRESRSQEFDSDIRLFSKVKEGTAVLDGVNCRETEPVTKKGRKGVTSFTRIKEEDLHSVAVSSQSVVNYAVQEAERAKACLGPPLQCLNEEETRRPHAVYLPNSLEHGGSKGLPRALRGEVEEDDRMRLLGSFWKKDHAQQKAQEAAKALRIRHTTMKAGRARRFARAKTKRSPMDQLEKVKTRLQQSTAAAIFKSLVGVA